MNENSTQDLLEWARSHYFGKYRGVVVNNVDPAQRGRLQVQIPAVLGDVSVWAMPCVPYAGDGVGFYAMPEPGTGVWLEFEAGDPSYPVWCGFFWGDGQLPDVADPSVKIWKTDKLTIRLDDQQAKLLIESSSGASITLSNQAVTDAGGAKHTVGSSGVVSEHGGAKAEVAQASFRVNSGAFEVM